MNSLLYNFLVLLLPSLLLFAPFPALVESVNPLSASSRWIVDSVNGNRVKLRCVNWASHLEPMITEGLDKKPLDNISSTISSLGFNCVRLTYATYMFTRPQFSNLAVSASLTNLNLTAALTGVASKNPQLLNLTLLQAYDAVVDSLGRAGLMVFLDNHVSKPMWCCSDFDGNGFFGDKYFDSGEWLTGLGLVAARYLNRAQVVGLSLRNELRGLTETTATWYKYVELGATKIHQTNPNALVLISGLNYDKELQFLANNPLKLNFTDKLVYEAHWYSFSDQIAWAVLTMNEACAVAVKRFEDQAGFLVRGGGDKAVPLFLSEFGFNMGGGDDRFLECFLGHVVERDFDWGLWALQGSYYLRSGAVGPEESYGVLNYGWDGVRNSTALGMLKPIFQMFQAPGASNSWQQLIYHPLSGKCVGADLNNNNNPIFMTDCDSVKAIGWKFTGDGNPIIMSTSMIMNSSRSLCMKSVGESKPVILSSQCSDQQSKWRVSSISKLQLATQDPQLPLLSAWCLESDYLGSVLMSKKCICHDALICSQDTGRQWFKFVSSNYLPVH